MLDAIHVLSKSLYHLMIDDIRNYRHMLYGLIPLISMSSNEPFQGTCTAPNCCGVHIHTGVDCSDVPWKETAGGVSHMGMGQVTFEITIFVRINIKLYQLL